MSPKIHVLLPVHNRKPTTERFVRLLLEQTYADWHLVVIDDGSDDGTSDMVKAFVPSATILRGAGHWWWAGALQQGYAWLRKAGTPPGDVVLIINDDTEFDEDFLAKAMRALKPRGLLVAQCYDLDTGHIQDAGLVWDWAGLNYKVLTDDSQPINCCSTRGLFLRWQDFMEIGGFHPLLLPHYLSDYEFTQRAFRKGFTLSATAEVFLKSDNKLTGIRTFQGHSLWRAMRMAMSIRSAMNPFYWSSFVLLACPMRYLPANLLRVWRRFAITLREQLQATS